MARTLAHRAQLHPGTNLRAWLLTIKRSIFLNAHRRMRSTPRLRSVDEMDEGTLARGAPSRQNRGG